MVEDETPPGAARAPARVRGRRWWALANPACLRGPEHRVVRWIGAGRRRRGNAGEAAPQGVQPEAGSNVIVLARRGAGRPGR